MTKTQTDIGSNPMFEPIFCVFKKKKKSWPGQKYPLRKSGKDFLWWGLRRFSTASFWPGQFFFFENAKNYFRHYITSDNGSCF